MTLQLKNRKLLLKLTALNLVLVCLVVTGILAGGLVWTRWDYQILDQFYKKAVESGKGPAASPLVKYLTVTNESYDYFEKHVLDRTDLGLANEILSRLGPQAVAYDMIFPRASEPEADDRFGRSLETLGNVFLPIGFRLSDEPELFNWQEGLAYHRLRENFLSEAKESGHGEPLYGVHPIMQMDRFFKVAHHTGHINMFKDPDGVHRHNILIIKVDQKFFPSLGLSMFLDYAGVPFEKVEIDWGRQIRIPATPESFLDRDVIVPIDHRGSAFIPFPQVWNRDFEQMAVHTLMKLSRQEHLEGNLTEFFEGNFVFVADVSQKASDIGQTPLEDRVPLVSVHASILNGLLTQSFYRPWTVGETVGLILVIGLIFELVLLPKMPWGLFAVAGLVLVVSVVFAWWQFQNFILFPVATVSGGTLFLFFGLSVGLYSSVSHEREFIRSAFFKYLPEKVVNELLDRPDLLQLGGEERVLTVLFVDLANFTSISEKINLSELRGFLNDYLTEMTDVILAEGGIIDKYLGDCIMAIFGAPIPLDNHADHAVYAGLKMLQQVETSRMHWGQQGFPDLECRVGINTGPMLIGNMGSKQAFDYTVIGDSVNLASRLEGTNKYYGTRLTISENTHKRLTPGLFRTRVLDVVKVKGKMSSVRIFEVIGEDNGDYDIRDLKYYRMYERGLQAYQDKRFAEAMKCFACAWMFRPDDLALENIIDRIVKLNPKSLPVDWDGSVALTTK